jgi:hypothetical protein
MRTKITLKKRVSSGESDRKDRTSSNTSRDNGEQQPPNIDAPNSAAYPPESLDMLKSVMQVMKDKYNLSLNDAVQVYQGISSQDTSLIPLSIFSTPLSPSESICKYLKECCNLTYHEIAEKINRDDRSVWTSYQRALKKYKEPFVVDREILLPIEIFNNRKFSMLEAIVRHLKSTYNFTAYKIAKLLNKNPSAMATVYKRVLEKEGDS